MQLPLGHSQESFALLFHVIYLILLSYIDRTFWRTVRHMSSRNRPDLAPVHLEHICSVIESKTALPFGSPGMPHQNQSCVFEDLSSTHSSMSNGSGNLISNEKHALTQRNA
jgi:hypothetical protein